MSTFSLRDIPTRHGLSSMMLQHRCNIKPSAHTTMLYIIVLYYSIQHDVFISDTSHRSARLANRTATHVHYSNPNLSLKINKIQKLFLFVCQMLVRRCSRTAVVISGRCPVGVL